MPDALSTYYADLLDGTYDSVDRIVVNAYFGMGHSPAGFRYWWRQLTGSDETLDDTHLMRLAGRFSRRLRAYAEAHAIPVIACEAGERKHLVAEKYRAEHPDAQGVFLILVARAQAPVWQVQRGENGFMNLRHPKHLPFVNHYYFHILDPDWGHVTIRMCGHPPFPAQILLNGHEYLACQLAKAGHAFEKEGNCFTAIQDGRDLALVADASRPQDAPERLSDAIGRLSQVCERWIYSACLCFALSSDEQKQSGFRYQFSVYQLEYSRNLWFHSGQQMDVFFETLIDRTRVALDVARLKTILGLKKRPYRRKAGRREEIVVERPVYNLSVFKIHFGGLTFKVYTKGERTLRVEVIVHNTRDLGCGRLLPQFVPIVLHLQTLLERFMNTLCALDAPFIADATWDALPMPSQVGASRVGGIDVHKPRMRAVLGAILALAAQPGGFCASDVAAKVCHLSGQTAEAYRPTQAAYDLKKLRGKHLIVKVGKSRRYEPTPTGLRTIAAVSVLRDKVLKPLLAGVSQPELGPRPAEGSSLDARYEALRQDMNLLLAELGIAA